MGTQKLSIDRIIPYLGKNLFLPAHQLAPEYCQDVLNVTFKDKTIRKRDGSKQFAPTETSFPVLGLWDFQFSSDLSRNLCKATNLDFKVYDQGADVWITRTPRTTEGTVDVVLPNTINKVTGVPWTAADLRVGDRFFKTSAGAGQNVGYRVSSVTIAGNGSCTIEPNWVDVAQAGITYQIDKLFNTGLSTGQGINPTAGGNLHQLYSAVVFSDTLAVGSYQDFLVFSNGADGIFSWQASPNLQPAAIRITDANAFQGRYLEAFVGRVFSAFTVEAGVNIPQRIRWSQFNNHRNWSGTGSGFLDLADTPDEIANIKSLVQVLAIYKRTSVYHAVPTGLVNDPIREQLRVDNKGLTAPYSLASFGEFHMLLSQDGFYRSGPGEFRRVDAGIDAFKELKARLNYNRINKVFGFANIFENEYWLCAPVGTSDFNNLIFVISLREGKQFFTHYNYPINYATAFRGGALRTWSGYTAGTVSVTNGNGTVTGVGTGWTTALVGRKFHVEHGQTGVTGGGVEYSVTAVASATSLTISPVWDGGTAGPGINYGISDYGTWDEQTGTWDEQETVAAPIVVWGEQSGKVPRVDPTRLNDGGTAIETFITLRADALREIARTGGREQLKTASRLILSVKFASPFTLDVWVSTSQGVNWDTRISQTVAGPPAGTPAGALVEVFVDFAVTGKDVTFRFSNTSSNEQFEIVSYRVEAIERGKAVA